MATLTTRTTIYLDEELLARARRFVPSRGLSQLLNDLLEERITQYEKREIEEQMREGYIAARQDRQHLNDDWQVVDVEGWPE
jgi:metal-responsive CopG/Arc/MetJ family transcriptional regulator